MRVLIARAYDSVTQCALSLIWPHCLQGQHIRCQSSASSDGSREQPASLWFVMVPLHVRRAAAALQAPMTTAFV